LLPPFARAAAEAEPLFAFSSKPETTRGTENTTIGMPWNSFLPDQAKKHMREKERGGTSCSLGWRCGEVAREAQAELEAAPLVVIAEAAIPSHLRLRSSRLSALCSLPLSHTQDTAHPLPVSYVDAALLLSIRWWTQTQLCSNSQVAAAAAAA